MSDIIKQAIEKFGKEAKHWTENDAKLYLEVGKIPDKTKRGNWVNSATRSNDTKQWSDGELLDWADGLLPLPNGVIEDDVWDQIRAHYKIPGNWTDESIRTFLTRGIKPQEIEPGVLLDDKIRNEKSLNQLTFTDMRLHLEDKVALNFTKEQLVGEIKRRLKLTTNFLDDGLLASLPSIEKDVSMNNMLVHAKLKEYKQARKEVIQGKKPSESTHAIAQAMLFNTLIAVMSRKDYREFVEGFEIILDFINIEYEGLFDPLNCMMGIRVASISKNDKDTFSDLLNLMIHTRQPQRRRVKARLYNLNTILRNVRNEVQRNNVIQYYTLE